MTTETKPVVIGHHLVYATAHAASNGDLSPCITHCADGDDVVEKAKQTLAEGVDYWESYFGYMRVYSDGSVSMVDMSASDLGEDEDVTEEKDDDGN